VGFITQQFKALFFFFNSSQDCQPSSLGTTTSTVMKENDRSAVSSSLSHGCPPPASGALVSPAQQNAVAPRESTLSISVGEWNQENIHLRFPTPYFSRRHPMAVSQSISRDPSLGIIAAKCGYLLHMDTYDNGDWSLPGLFSSSMVPAVGG
jgi:hypothetical protein